jgi:hypothetical protein
MHRIFQLIQARWSLASIHGWIATKMAGIPSTAMDAERTLRFDSAADETAARSGRNYRFGALRHPSKVSERSTSDIAVQPRTATIVLLRTLDVRRIRRWGSGEKEGIMNGEQ